MNVHLDRVLPHRPGPLETLRRSFVFARHVPPRKLFARLQLTFRRRTARLVLPSAPDVILRSEIPRPLFPARESGARKIDRGWRIRYLNQEEIFPDGITWRPQGVTQLRVMTLNYLEFVEGLSGPDAEALISDWLDHGFPYVEGCWADVWNSYAASLRAVVLMQQLCRDDLSVNVKRRMMEAGAIHAAYVEQNLELDLGGNHLVKNIKALIWASATYDGAAASRWRRLGLELLRRELPEQILQDGLHAERSVSYHAQVFADLLEIRHALGGDPFEGELDDILDRMAQAICDLAHPDGLPALFNDGGLRMAYAPAQCLTAYGAVFGRAEPQARSVFDFPDAGYSGARVGDDYLVCDFGLIGPDDLPGHGHSDIGSFEWSAAGVRIIVDQGVFEYVPGARRQMSKASAAHNTLSIAENDQADFFGAFRCGRRPRILSRNFMPDGKGFRLTGSHNGWSRAPAGPLHFRTIQYDGRDIEISDRLSEDPGLPVRISFLLHPAVSVVTRDDGLELHAGQVRVSLETASPCAVEGAVWWPNLGEEHRTQRIVISPKDIVTGNVITLRVLARQLEL